jgi:hypothetical protein
MKQHGNVRVECTLSFKGNVDVVLSQDMTIAEIVHDIIHCGDYEYEVVGGNMKVEDVEDYDDWEDYTE